MLRRLCVLLFLIVGCAFGQTAIPSTRAGQTLQAWLDAFNSGDRAKIETYIKTFDPNQTVESMMGFRNQTGGFDVLSIESSEPLLIKFRVKEKSSPTTAFGNLQVKDAQPATVEHFGLRAMPPGATVENVKLDDAERQRVVAGVVANLKEYYVYPDIAQKMADSVEAHQKHGDYAAVADGDAFADLLTDHLREVSHDKHLGVRYSPFKLPPDSSESTGPSPEDLARMQKQMVHMNCGFDKVEILSGNIGYVKFNMFADPSVCGPTVVAAMNFLAHVDAIIFDNQYFPHEGCCGVRPHSIQSNSAADL